eukprot:gene6020-8158_t
MRHINLRPESGVSSIAEILRRVAERAKDARPGEWIKGRGYDHNELAERRHPTAEELDKVAPNNPVCLTRTCGHVAIINTAAMREAGIGHNTPSPDGGLIERRDNRLTGLIAERALRLIVDASPRPTKDELRDAIDRASRFMLSQGFTSVMDAAVGMAAGMDEIAAYEEMARDGTLPLRVWVCVYGNADGIAEDRRRIFHLRLDPWIDDRAGIAGAQFRLVDADRLGMRHRYDVDVHDRNPCDRPNV